MIARWIDRIMVALVGQPESSTADLAKDIIWGV
jgi:hypothetical protein